MDPECVGFAVVVRPPLGGRQQGRMTPVPQAATLDADMRNIKTRRERMMASIRGKLNAGSCEQPGMQVLYRFKTGP